MENEGIALLKWVLIWTDDLGQNVVVMYYCVKLRTQAQIPAEQKCFSLNKHMYQILL